MKFKLKSSFKPDGDQPEAIRALVDGIKSDTKNQVLLGVTGSGKTFTIANVIQQVQLPTLVLSHNKTLAAQLFQEFREFFPDNAVEYFVSFYDYYQPEAYLPASDTFIEKTSMINDNIDRLRLRSTNACLSRKDVIIVASVSCIYGIGSPEAYLASSFMITAGSTLDRRSFLQKLTEMQYTRNDYILERGTFRVKGDVIELQLAYEETGIRIETFGDQIDRICKIAITSGKVLGTMEQLTIFPAKHFMTTGITMPDAIAAIEEELATQLTHLRNNNRLLEAQRLEQRTHYDMEMLREVGYVNGIENYSRILDGRASGSRPYTLIDFFKRPFLTIIDESHASIPQIRGMYNGDRARKTTLVDHGFRLPCALDNRPLVFSEFEQLMDYVVYVSATPGDYELEKSEGLIIEQVIRPTHLVDPPIEIRPAATQVDDLIEQLRVIVERNERALVTTLTKKMSEDLTDYLTSLDFKVKYLHSDIETLDRTDILRDLRKGEFDILIGINLLREGLDLPEVSLVAILDADKEGFLRSTRSIVQTAGRAARNINGRIILYADTVTESIRRAIDESSRRRTKQLAYNEKHGITPQTIVRRIDDGIMEYDAEATPPEVFATAEPQPSYGKNKTRSSAKKGGTPQPSIEEVEKEMQKAAKALDFEKAARLRDILIKAGRLNG